MQKIYFFYVGYPTILEATFKWYDICVRILLQFEKTGLVAVNVVITHSKA